MGWLQVVGYVFQLILLVLPRIFKGTDEKKQEALTIYEQGKKAIKARDASGITLAFSKLRSL
jgi:hypothetical protein